MAGQSKQDTKGTTRLTSLAHGGGCGCKLSPAVLKELLDGQMADTGFADLLIGNGQSDDAAVWAIDGADNEGGRCIVATTDFFMPIVDDPTDFGRIAATNAISDIYAMGGRPLFALAILGMPLGKIENATVRDILAGGAQACREAGIPVAGGHSIDSAEPIYGLAVIGEVERENLKSNSAAQAGDVLILTKPLGVGIYSAALKRGDLNAGDYADLIATTTKLNSIGQALAQSKELGEKVHAITDVTGFALLGHGLEMARGSGVDLVIDAAAIPLLPRAQEWARLGKVTGASPRNWASVSDGVILPPGTEDWQRDLLTDPQTSGGLLISVSPDAAQAVLAQANASGLNQATIIGYAQSGAGQIVISNN